MHIFKNIILALASHSIGLKLLMSIVKKKAQLASKRIILARYLSLEIRQVQLAKIGLGYKLYKKMMGKPFGKL